jgi:hypothetical protein
MCAGLFRLTTNQSAFPEKSVSLAQQMLNISSARMEQTES